MINNYEDDSLKESSLILHSLTVLRTTILEFGKIAVTNKNAFFIINLDYNN